MAVARILRAHHIGVVPEPAILVETLTKRFGDIIAVDAIGFTVTPGTTVGLLGGNGAGKTTTLAMILGLLLPTSGAVRVLGEDMLRHRHRVLARLNFSSPYVDLPHRLTVRENLTVYAELYGLTAVRRRVDRICEDLDLAGIRDRAVGQLSSGQRTRVALAKALINEPELLLLDEPTASLDPDTADWVRAYLESFQHQTGATILLASHNMAEVERMCDEVLILKAGRLVDRGRAETLIARHGRATLEEVFLDIARGDGFGAPSVETMDRAMETMDRDG